MARTTMHNSYVTEENWAEVSQDNKQLFKDFIDYCKTEDKSPATVKVYTSNIKIFLVWVLHYSKNKRFVDMTKRDVMQFQNWMVNVMSMSPARVRNLRASVSSMSNFIEDILDDEYPDFKNILSKIKPPAKQLVREKTVLSNEKVGELLKKLVDAKEYQKACFVACLAASGVRKGEVINFQVSFFNDKALDEEGMYHTPKMRTKGHGKLGKQMIKYIIKDIVQPYFELWMKERTELGIAGDDLFVVKHQEIWCPIKIGTVNGWMGYFSKLIEEDCYSHAFRHYSATYLKKNGATIDQIKEFLGHNDTATTQIYIDISSSENLKGMLDFMHKDELKEKSDEPLVKAKEGDSLVN